MVYLSAAISIPMAAAFAQGTVLSGSPVEVHPGPGAIFQIGISVFLLLCSVAVSFLQAFYPFKYRISITHIVLGLVGLVASFAGLFLLTVVVGDLDDAVSKYNYYRAQGLRTPSTTLAAPIRRIEEIRPFSGISARVWTGVDVSEVDGSGLASAPASEDDRVLEMVESARRPVTEVVKFNIDNVAPVFFDCLHFSIVTLATVGFGDIVPRTWLAKLLVDLEIFSGMVFIVIGIGMGVGMWSSDAKRR